jgi:hypothetical protein
MSTRYTATFIAIAISAFLPATVSAQGAADIPLASTTASQATEAGAAFVASLRAEQRDAVVHAIDAEERSGWSNIPMFTHPRPGLRIRDLTIDQRLALHELLGGSLSSVGFEKISHILRLDSIHGARELANLERNGPSPDDRPFVVIETETFGSGSYAVSIFGNPGRDAGWGWLIQGHHMGISFTVSGANATFTPMFLGASPLVLDEGIHAGWSGLSHEVARGNEIIASLTPSQREIVLEPGNVPGDALYSVGRRDEIPEMSGLRSGDMTPQQQRLLRALVEEYVRNADFDVADAQLAAIGEAGWDNLWLSWRGPTDDLEAPHYYRVHGERILIELAYRPNHIHTIVRDPQNDYGEDWLGLSYTEEYTAADRFDAAVRAFEER